ncbi:amidase family protein [Acidisphaera sp. L21]|uniref:amidase family protein n=1 Tax=Acidisphaera sp. L21 TaxID=1641851 RepID=UPI00131BCA3C|nr:amidase family protein [Acidisphaera sp. L21]
MTDLWRLSATELAARIRRRDVSAREAALAGLARLDAVNPKINAVVDHRPNEVLAAADAVDATIARGDDPRVLGGVPVTVKVNTDQTGYATTNGVRLQKDLIASSNSPVVDNLQRAGAVILGRTNTPAFSYRWFTTNLLHGDTKNPRDASLTPGGSSGGAAAAVTAGIGHLAHGTDIAGSIRYPAYACGVHGLRPTPGRVPAYNASGPERPIGPQISAVSGPIGRTIADLRLGLAAFSAPDPRDPWYVPAPLEGPAAPRRAALCLRPDGLATSPEVVAALMDSADRMRAAGWVVEEVDALPPLREAAEMQTKLWLGDRFEAQLASVTKEGDPGAMNILAQHEALARSVDPAMLGAILMRRAAILRLWQVFLEDTPVVLLPVCAELPFPDQQDMKGAEAFQAVWEAQMIQVALPVVGLPGLTVSTGMVGTVPVGVQLVSRRYREDLCLAAGEAIEAGGVPASPIDPV